jgi:acetolactate synthase regulatory subunit
MNVVYGSTKTLPIGQELHLPGPTLPVLPVLPGPDSPTPRRRRTIVCTNLAINGERWDLEEAQEKMRKTLRGDWADIRCDNRPGVQIAADYATDVCLSSWCRTCPFAVAVAPAAPQPKPKQATWAAELVRQVQPRPQPTLAYADVPWAKLTPAQHAIRIRAAMSMLQLTKADVSRVLGVVRRRGMQRQELAAAVGANVSNISSVLNARQRRPELLARVESYLGLAS